MKRFAWLALFSFCTALAQVQPVQPVAGKNGQCSCCEEQTAGSCAHGTAKGMEDCTMPCAPCVPALNTLLPATVIVAAASPAEVTRLNWQHEKGRTLAYPPLLTPPRFLG